MNTDGNDDNDIYLHRADPDLVHTGDKNTCNRKTCSHQAELDVVVWIEKHTESDWDQGGNHGPTVRLPVEGDLKRNIDL